MSSYLRGLAAGPAGNSLHATALPSPRSFQLPGRSCLSYSSLISEGLASIPRLVYHTSYLPGRARSLYPAGELKR